MAYLPDLVAQWTDEELGKQVDEPPTTAKLSDADSAVARDAVHAYAVCFRKPRVRKAPRDCGEHVAEREVI